MAIVPALSYVELLAYTDEETRRWREYFQQNPKALETVIGGRHNEVRGLVTHIFVSEFRWGQHLVGEQPTPNEAFKPQTLEEVWAIYATARRRMESWVAKASPEEMDRILTVRSATYNRDVTASKRKILTHALIHGIRHWAQIATALRQACFVSDWPHDMLYSPALR
jgi:uncharacterized damage-inducible protein DinB